MSKNSIQRRDGGGAMKIAVIGAGNIGRTLGSKWAAAGHEVVYGVRSPGAPGTAVVGLASGCCSVGETLSPSNM